MTQTLRVWDPLVRIFHWSLVLFFFTAYLSEDDFESLHVWAGYTVAGLVTFRIIWGLIGTRHARFSDFVYSPANVFRYLIALPAGRAARRAQGPRRRGSRGLARRSTSPCQS